MKLNRLFVIIAIALIILFTSDVSSVGAEEERKPIDMMIVIDNSCSMFPGEKRISCCDDWGNDPAYLRVFGSDLFIARLGFAEGNEADFQAGVISLGDEPILISPLQPLSAARDALARTIANPSPACATRIVLALESAYQELRTSPNRRPTNMPAIVLITDGRPYPSGGQSEDDIEWIVRENPDVPLFIILLRNPDKPSDAYEIYIKFWQKMQASYEHVFVYPISGSDQIVDTYNNIVAQLQTTVPSECMAIEEDKPLEFYVGNHIEKIVVTVVYSSVPPAGMVTVQDPNFIQVLDVDEGVKHFRGVDNPVEVISISKPRLGKELKAKYWSISSDEPVTVCLDRQAYRINFLTPSVGSTGVPNVYIASGRYSPKQPLVIRFNLLDTVGNTVTDPQPIQGMYINPDGAEEKLHVGATGPDKDGIYSLTIDLPDLYLPILTESGRFNFIINAGSADEKAIEARPIATARIMVDAGIGPYIASVEPDPLVCTKDKSAAIKIGIGDFSSAIADTMHLRVLGEGDEVSLVISEPGVFEGDLLTLCTAVLESIACSVEQESLFQLHLSAQLADGSPLPPVSGEIRIQAVAPVCTATPLPPTPTLTPSPTPLPTPVPPPSDSDKDGVPDTADRCPNTPLWDDLTQFDGCPPPWWVLVLVGLLVLGILAFVGLWLIPWIQVQVSPPPKGYVQVYRKGKREGTMKSVRSLGLQRRTVRVTIGGDPKKDVIYVLNLKPSEFVVERQADRVVLLDAEKGTLRGTFNDRTATQVPTSDTDVVLRISLDQNRL
jgi:hypothetical protein